MLICRDGYCTPIMQPTITEPQRKSTPTPSAHACSAANRLSRPTNAGTVSFPRRRESSPSNAPFPQTRSFPSARKQPPAARSTPFPYGQPLWLPHPSLPPRRPPHQRSARIGQQPIGQAQGRPLPSRLHSHLPIPPPRCASASPREILPPPLTTRFADLPESPTPSPTPHPSSAPFTASCSTPPLCVSAPPRESPPPRRTTGFADHLTP